MSRGVGCGGESRRVLGAAGAAWWQGSRSQRDELRHGCGHPQNGASAGVMGCGSEVSAGDGRDRAEAASPLSAALDTALSHLTRSCSLHPERAHRASAQHGPPSGPAPARLTAYGANRAMTRGSPMWRTSRGSRLWGVRRCNRSAIDDRGCLSLTSDTRRFSSRPCLPVRSSVSMRRFIRPFCFSLPTSPAPALP